MLQTRPTGSPLEGLGMGVSWACSGRAGCFCLMRAILTSDIACRNAQHMTKKHFVVFSALMRLPKARRQKHLNRVAKWTRNYTCRRKN